MPPTAESRALRARSNPLETPEYRPLFPRTVLNECRGGNLPFAWSINPYRGCEFGCRYCFARTAHGFLDLPPEAFERRIYVKIGAGEVLRSALKPGMLRGRPVALGTATDPYQPAESHFHITRQILEVLSACPDLDLSITTKSPLILHDLDLLVAIARRRPLRVNVSIISDDPRLARLLEARAPSPRRRFDLLRRLAQAGIPTAVFVMPILPGITDGPDQMLRLLRRARESGAERAEAGLLHLESAASVIFRPLLRRHFPDQWERYRVIYQSPHAPRRLIQEIEDRFNAARREAGFGCSAREVSYEPMPGEQLELGV